MACWDISFVGGGFFQQFFLLGQLKSSYFLIFSVAVGPISYFIGPELVPLQHRSAIFCLCYALNNIFIFVTNFLALALFRFVFSQKVQKSLFKKLLKTTHSFRHLGAACFVPLFVLPSVVALVYIQLYLPETKNKETHVIVAMLKAGRRKINAKPELIVNKF